MNQVDLRKPFRLARSWVYMMSLEIVTEIQRLFDREICKVLISKSYYASLGNEKSKLVFTGIGERAELNAGTKLGRDMRSIDFGVG